MMELTKALPEDTGEIYNIMVTPQSLLADKGWYCIDTEIYIREHIQNPLKGTVFKAVENGEIGAFVLIHLPEMDANHLGHYAGLKQEALSKCAYIDSLAVKPAFRGRQLQCRLMACGEAYLSVSGCCHLFGTVFLLQPRNTAPFPDIYYIKIVLRLRNDTALFLIYLK